MGRLSLFLFGAYQVQWEGKELTRSLPLKGRALLAYLVREQSTQRRDKLACLLWPDCNEAQAHHNLSQAVYGLRQALPPGKPELLRIDAQEIEFNPQADVWVDVAEFSDLLDACEHHVHPKMTACPECFERLQRAARLYRGEFLADFSFKDIVQFDEWCMVQREHLHRQAMQVLQRSADYHAAQGDLVRALEYAWQQVELDPLGEPGHRQLICLLSESGRRNEALVHFQTLRRTLHEMLGVAPDAETLALVERIQYQAAQPSHTSLPTARPGSITLPEPLTPFIGRENKLATLTAWLRDPGMRLITILGSGGSGKTRLALQAARALRDDFPDGIFFVSLSGLGSSEAFLPALASAMSIDFQPNWGGPFEQLVGYLQHRRLLLILDSFEEVPAAADQVISMLQGAGDVHVLVTSRTRLNVQGEQVFPLEGMCYPEPTNLNGTPVNLEDYSALQLFHSAVRQVRPGYTHSPEDLPHLARICQLVAGMPLGLVLAAGWLETCTPAEIAIEIERSLDFLSASWRDLPERQRSLRATLDYSWHLLDEDERRAFERLSVFQSAFTRHAAEQMAQVNAIGLRKLVDKSMLQTADNKYRMHDLLRQYAAEKLVTDCADAEQVQDAHSAYYLTRLAQHEPRLKSAQRSAVLREMDTEASDFQTAWERACKQANIALLEASLEGLGLYYEMRMRFRGGEQACRAGLSTQAADLQEASAAVVLRARLLLWQASFQVALGELEPARQSRQEGEKLLDQLEPQGFDVRRPRAMYWQAEGEDQTDLQIKLDYFQRGIALFQELSDTWRQAEMLIWAGEFAMRLGNGNQALQYQEEALRLSRQLGEPNLLLHSLRQINYLYFILNQVDHAHQTMQETAEFIETVEELPLRANAQMHMGGQLVWSGSFPEAIRSYESALPVLRSLGYRYGVVFGSMGLGLTRMFIGEYTCAEDYLLTVFPEAEQGGFPREAAIELIGLGMATLAQRHTAQALEHFRESARRYRQMQFSGELGWALAGLSLAQQADGQTEAALDTLVEALQIAAKTHSMFTMVPGLPAMEILLAQCGHLETALLVHRVAKLVSVLKNSRWYADIVGTEMDAQWEKLPEQRRLEVEAAAKSHTPFSIIPEVLNLLTSKDKNEA